MPTLIRLNKYLASAGVTSRRKIDELLTNGRITVNNKLATLGQKVNPDSDSFQIDGKPVDTGDSSKHIYILLHKPQGVVSTSSDEKGRPTVIDLVKIPTRVIPVGRLDQYTTGLILLTNDGELTYRLTHPRFHIEKTYVVSFSGRLHQNQLLSLQHGVLLTDGKTQPAKIDKVEPHQFNITISEGKNRQIRRMCQKVGIHLLHLHRESLAFLTLGKLTQSNWRYLTSDEIQKLRQLASL